MAYSRTFCVFTLPFIWNVASSPITIVLKKFSSRLHRSMNHRANCVLLAKSCCKSWWRTCIRYRWRQRSNLVILLNVACGKPNPFRLTLVPIGCSKSCCLTVSMLISDRPERLPEFPLFPFRFRLVPCTSNLRTFAEMVVIAGSRLSGKHSPEATRVCGKLFVS